MLDEYCKCGVFLGHHIWSLHECPHCGDELVIPDMEEFEEFDDE